MTYHIKPNGETGKCRAEYQCPYGNMSSHSEDTDKLRSMYENFMSNLDDNTKTAKFYFSTGEEVEAFTMGDCAHLAKSLAKKIEGQLIVISSEKEMDPNEEEPLWNHMAVKTKDGRILDVEGLWNEEDFIKKLSYGKAPVSLHKIDEKNFKNFEANWMNFDIKPTKTANKIIKHLKDFVQL